MHGSHATSLALAFAIAMAAPAAGTSFTDPAGDLLASFTGPQNPDLDILTGTVTYTSTDLLLSSTFAGPVGATPGSLFLWGIDRGAGTPGLTTSGPPVVGPPTILLDAIVRILPNGTGAVLLFSGMGPPTTIALDAGAITVAGNSISARVSRALLPSTGFAFEDYTSIHWSRSEFGSQAFIADLAPDDAGVTASFVPEPASWALMIAGFGAVGLAARRSRALPA